MIWFSTKLKEYLFLSIVFSAASARTKKNAGGIPYSDPNHYGECGGLIIGNNGTIVTPGYPNRIPNTYTKCSWDIKGTAGAYVEFIFDKFDLPGKDDRGECTEAFIKIGDYKPPFGLKIERYVGCGTVAPPPFKSHRPYMWVEFVSTGSKLVQYEIRRYTGFKAHFSLQGTDLSNVIMVTVLAVAMIAPALLYIMLCPYLERLHRRENSLGEYTPEDKLADKLKMMNHLDNINRQKRERAAAAARSHDVKIEISDKEIQTSPYREDGLRRRSSGASPDTEPKRTIHKKLSRKSSLRKRVLLRGLSYNKAMDQGYIPASPNLSYSGAYPDRDQCLSPGDVFIVGGQMPRMGKASFHPEQSPMQMKSFLLPRTPGVHDYSSSRSFLDAESDRPPRSKRRKQPTCTSSRELLLAPVSDSMDSIPARPEDNYFRTYTPDKVTTMHDPVLEEKISPIEKLEEDIIEECLGEEGSEMFVDGDVEDRWSGYLPEREIPKRPDAGTDERAVACCIQDDILLGISESDVASEISSGLSMRSVGKSLIVDRAVRRSIKFNAFASSSDGSTFASSDVSPQDHTERTSLASIVEERESEVGSTTQEESTTAVKDAELSIQEKSHVGVETTLTAEETRPVHVDTPRDYKRPGLQTRLGTARFPPPHVLSTHVKPYPSMRMFSVTGWKSNDDIPNANVTTTADGEKDVTDYAEGAASVPDTENTYVVAEETKEDVSVKKDAEGGEEVQESPSPGVFAALDLSGFPGNLFRVSPLNSSSLSQSKSAPDLHTPTPEHAQSRPRHGSTGSLTLRESHPGSGAKPQLSLPQGVFEKETFV